jgi:lipopolysaccharide export system permease protein
MTLLQNYLRKQGFWPLVLTLSALAFLAVLTQSLSTLDLIVENRQSAATFFYITILAIPQLIAIILPLAVFIAVLYAINRLNTDSELIVAKASGLSPWKISTPIIRLAVLAAMAHLIINIAVQPYAFRQMRAELLKVKTDLASQVVRAGEFNSPTPGLTLYSRLISPNGVLTDVIIHDSRNPDQVQTYQSKTGQISKTDGSVQLSLFDGTIQEIVENGQLDLISFETYAIDLSEIIALDTVLRLKKTDRYLHELLRPDLREVSTQSRRDSFIAEGHSRLASPLYCIALALLALAFLIRGEMQRTGYSQKIAICAVLGFMVRLIGFGIEAGAETSAALNIVQYVFPLTICIIALLFLLQPGRVRKPKFLQSKLNRNAFETPAHEGPS